MLFVAFAISSSTVNLFAYSSQSGCGSWHEVSVPSNTSYSCGPVFTTILPVNRNGLLFAYTIFGPVWLAPVWLAPALLPPCFDPACFDPTCFSPTDPETS